jgi:SAM-dependent methyltransferase
MIGAEPKRCENFADRALAIYERDADVYSHDRSLHPAERELLRRLRRRWHKLAMIDVGVGAGRTSYTFGAVAGRYVGVDYSSVMVERARQAVGEDEQCRFMLADVRDLSMVTDRFDVALFSLNGLDSLGHYDRLEALRQLRGVMTADGVLLFSSHSVHALQNRFPRYRGPSHPVTPAKVYRLARATARSLIFAGIKAQLDLDSIERVGWTQARDGAHHFQLPLYYVTAWEQQRQLEETGWRLMEIWDLNGKEVDPACPGGDWWLHYLCQPA